MFALQAIIIILANILKEFLMSEQEYTIILRDRIHWTAICKPILEIWILMEDKSLERIEIELISIINILMDKPKLNAHKQILLGEVWTTKVRRKIISNLNMATFYKSFQKRLTITKFRLSLSNMMKLMRNIFTKKSWNKRGNLHLIMGSRKLLLSQHILMRNLILFTTRPQITQQAALNNRGVR